MRVSIPHLLSICKQLAKESGKVIRNIHASGSLGIIVKYVENNDSFYHYNKNLKNSNYLSFKKDHRIMDKQIM